MTGIFSSSQWNTSPKAYWTIQYEYQRNGAGMQYRFYWKVWIGYSDSYYYNGLRLKLFIDGAQRDVTVKAYNKNEKGWSYDGTTEWYTVPNKASGTTAFYAQLYDTNTNTTEATSSTYQLAVIASQATITGADNFNDEQNPTIYYSNPAGNDVTSLQACISFDGSSADISYREIAKTGTYYTFQLTDAERTVLRNNTQSNSRKLFFYLKTVVGSTEYYDRAERDLTIVNANPIFSANQVDYVDTNRATTAVTDSGKHIVQNKSTLSVTFTEATAIKGAKITSYSVSVNGVAKALTSAGTIDFGTINANSDLSLVVTAIDSRGNSTPVYKTVTIIPYSEPTVSPYTSYNSIVCERCDENGTVADEGTFLKLVVQGKWNTLPNEKNGASVQVKAAYAGYDSGWINVPATASGGGASNNYFKWYDINTKVDGLTLDTTKAYTVTVRCIDSIGGYKDIPYTIPTSDVCLHLRKGGNGASFGEYSQDEKPLNVASDWDFKMKGSIVNDFVVEQGTSGIWTYRKWNSGIAECWGSKEHIVSFNTVWGALYDSGDVFYENYPNGLFIEQPYCHIGYRSNGGAILGIEQGGSGSSIRTHDFWFVRPTTGTNMSIYAMFYVIGKWK